MRFLKHTVLIFGLLAGMGMTSLLSQVPASAAAPATAGPVDILNRCSDTGAIGTTCADCKSGTGATTAICKESQTSGATKNPIIHFITIIIDIISYIAGAAAIISLIVSGLRIILANGDSNAVATARSGILYSVIGIIVIVLAQSIVVFVLNKIK